MADIKTRDTSKGTIKTISRAAVATERMKKAYEPIIQKYAERVYCYPPQTLSGDL